MRRVDAGLRLRTMARALPGPVADDRRRSARLSQEPSVDKITAPHARVERQATGGTASI
ncbi:hypothetical protein C7S16_0613 [Burkholderia thailandensis]|uniref:Uncharacterized protein n=1 Tax=Burkholderia thailandensis TaxID=57975 RepID=A0AAW9CVT4_BURTH|nr:hypothetical protein [Burkholderia thailandensis]MDW9254775.1 hypothetical protein [Burkholderia thailandensis]